jgi:hypothetical protein
MEVFTTMATNLSIQSDGFVNTRLLNFMVPATFDTLNFWGVRRVSITVSARGSR